MVPLDDGRDLWANADYVCGFVNGQAIVVMFRFEYDEKRKALIDEACKTAISENPRAKRLKEVNRGKKRLGEDGG